MSVSTRRLGMAVLTASLVGVGLQASSHREAPGITKTPKLDGSGSYMFTSYEAGLAGFVTLLANYLPLQDGYGGPNFFMLDPDAVYEIHLDNDGDAREDVTFQFRFRNTPKDITLNIGGKDVAVPLVNVGPIGPNRTDTSALNVIESYTLTMIKGDRRVGVTLELVAERNPYLAAAGQGSACHSSSPMRARRSRALWSWRSAHRIRRSADWQSFWASTSFDLPETMSNGRSYASVRRTARACGWSAGRGRGVRPSRGGRRARTGHVARGGDGRR